MMTLPKNYRDARAACPNCVLLFRIGDVHQAFDDDAKLVARVLGLPLSNYGDELPVVQFRHRHMESYLGKLVAAGHRVAICEPWSKPPDGTAVLERIAS